MRPPIGHLSALVLTASLALLSCTPTAAQPSGRDGGRKLERSATKKVVIDEAFFSPWLLGQGAPSELRSAYKSFASSKVHEARKGLETFLAKNPRHELAPKALFLLAWIEANTGRNEVASKLFLEAADSWPLLSDYALYYGARAAYASGDYPRTIRNCLEINIGSRFGPRSKYLRGVALLKLDEVTHAAGVLEEYVAAYPNSSLLPEVKLDLALAYEAQSRGTDAAKVYQSLKMRYPDSSVEKRAAAGIARVRSKLSKKDRRSLLTPSNRDLVLRARALNDKHRSEKVVSEMTALLSQKRGAPKSGSKTWCDATWLVGAANTKARDHDAAAAAYKSFITHCNKDERAIKALFTAGKGLWTRGKDADALSHFERVWKEYPNHSYADDAMLYAARIRRGQNDRARSVKLLERQVSTFPRGDMLGDAHWLLFLDLFERGKLDEAVAYVDALGDSLGEGDLYTRGRLLYFRARALELSGKRKAGIKGFEEVARKVPMSYYALLSLNRLRALDTKRYGALMGQLSKDGKAEGEWTVEPPQVASDSTFKRGVALLRLGLFDEARVEFKALKSRYPDNDRLLWIVTLLFDRAGAYHLSHDIPRRQIATFGTSYPVGSARSLYELAYPRPFNGPVKKWAKKRGIPEALIYAIMREESGFNPTIESWANAYGLMQLMLPTAQQMAKEDKLRRPKKLQPRHLFEPDTNVRLGSRYLETLLDYYGGHPSMAIAGYNGGQGNLDRWLGERGTQPFDLWVEEIPFGQTRGYTKRVTMSLWVYQWLGAGPKGRQAERMVTVPLTLPKPN